MFYCFAFVLLFGGEVVLQSLLPVGTPGPLSPDPQTQSMGLSDTAQAQTLPPTAVWPWVPSVTCPLFLHATKIY